MDRRQEQVTTREECSEASVKRRTSLLIILTTLPLFDHLDLAHATESGDRKFVTLHRLAALRTTDYAFHRIANSLEY